MTCRSVKFILSVLCWRLATLPPKGGTIATTVFNFSVRNGKRWFHGVKSPTQKTQLFILKTRYWAPTKLLGLARAIGFEPMTPAFNRSPRKLDGAVL